MTREVDASGREELSAGVKRKYGSAALRVAEGATATSCCGSSGCCGSTTEAWDPITSDLYDEGDRQGIPAAALLASLGCGNPTALAQLNAGETVLDLGSGGGIDVLLSAKRVGPTGKVYGLDMTDEMLELANENKKKAGVENVEFLRGEIEHIPLPNDAVDVIISNCVINLSADKRQVLSEAFRVLKPGGRFAVSDVVVRGEVPSAVRKNMELWIGCVAGALEEDDFLSLLREVGFEQPSIEPTRVYSADDAAAFLEGSGLDAETFAREIDGKFFSGFVRATKPRAAIAAESCCGPDCCTAADGRAEQVSRASSQVVEYRAAERGDYDSVARLLQSLHLPVAGVPANLADFQLASSDGRVVGVAGLEAIGDSVALLRSVAVHDAYRDLGIARRLLDRIEDLARSRDVASLYLLTTSAAGYFEKRGFVRVDRSAVPQSLTTTAEFQGACPASATAMKLDLGDSR